MVLAASNRICANHLERPAIAQCMGCGKLVCQECATRWQGIHYCVSCLADQRSAAPARSSLPAWLSVGIVIAALFGASSYLMVWLATLTAGLF